MSVTPPLPPRGTALKQYTPAARQAHTAEGLLAEVKNKSTYSHVPFVGWIQSHFVVREVKLNYIGILEEQFLAGAENAGWSRKEAWSVFEHFIRPKLLATLLEDLPKIEEFWKFPHGIEVFMNITAAFPSDESLKGVKTLTQLIDRVLEVMSKNPQGTEWLLNNYGRVNFLMANRFNAANRFEYVQTFLKILLTYTPDEFTTISQKIDAFLKYSESVQSERPKIYSVVDKMDLEAQFSADDFAVLRDQYPFINHVYEEIFNMAVERNTQGILENIGLYYLPLGEYRWTKPHLHTRYFESLVSLSFEQHVPFQLLEDSDEIIDFEGALDLYITNEKTMETRSLHLPFPLPFKGKMSKTEARRLLKLLEAAIDGPKQFNEVYQNLGFDPARRNDFEPFLTWAADANREYVKLIFDFNPTPKRPVMAYAQETPEYQAALQNLGDSKKALEVAKAKNIYRIDGKLSLLPKNIAQHHPHMATISQSELRKTAQMLFSTEIHSVSLALNPTLNADVSLEVKLTGSMLQLTTTFKIGDTTHARTTFYALEPNQNERDRLNEIIATELFERDLLLAKAEFMGAYGQL